MALAHSLLPLLILRFCAGIGIGGALPNAATLTSEYTPLNRRPFATTLTLVCIPLGGVIAGIIASSLLSTHSWQLLFVVAGLLPLLLACVLLVALPESPRFLAKTKTNAAQLAAILKSIGRPVHAHLDLTLHEETRAVETTRSQALFGGRKGRDTLALWGAFFFCLLTVYLAFNWLPSILLSCHLTSREASQGLTLYNFGGIVGAIAVGWWISLKGSRLPMSLSAILAIVSAGFIAWLVSAGNAPHAILLTVVGIHGLTVNAVQTTLYALATHMYATRIRATGVAFALAIGRIGAIVSAYLGAGLLALRATNYFLVLAGTMCLVLVSIQLIRNHIDSRH